VILEHTREHGTNNDGYADELGLVLSRR